MDDEWQERLTAAVKETLRKRAAMRDLRRQHAEARAYGLAQRHARKLRRQQAAGDTTTKENPMTDTTTKPWMPVFVFNSDAENCAVCDDVLDRYLATIAVGADGRGPVCEKCTEQLGDFGEGLWMLAEGLDKLDMAIWKLPQALRVTMTGRAREVLLQILEWRLGPITDEDKAQHVVEMAEQDKMLSLPGGRVVPAKIYDPEIHGPFLP